MTTKTNRVGRGEESKLEANAIAWVGGYVRVGEGIKQVVLAMVKASSATESAPDTGWASVGRMKHLRRSSLAVAVFRAVGCARLGGPDLRAGSGKSAVFWPKGLPFSPGPATLAFLPFDLILRRALEIERLPGKKRVA